ncbi:MAG: YdcF family protein [Thermotaleaceae bacterium]
MPYKKQLFQSLLLFFTLLFIFIEWKIIRTPYYEKPSPADTIIVLGAHLWGDQPSPLLQYRLDKAIELYGMGYAANIIVSGAQGDDEITTEAKAMAAYLVRHYIPEENIYLEEQSYNTFQNLKFSKEIMDKEGFEDAIIITNTFHLYRSLRIAKYLSIPATGSAAKIHPLWSLKLKYYTREFLSVLKFLVLRS